MPESSRFKLSPIQPRDPTEEGRVASSLELFFDLVFVVAVSFAASHLHSAVSAGDVREALVNYAIVFFGIWWAWMNFTWFATSFDNDDWLYRLMTFLQMSGVLVLAAGIGPAFDRHDFSILIFAYVVMRIAMAGQWLRAARRAGPARRAALTYAVGIVSVQALWLSSLALPRAFFLPALCVLIATEISVPIIAEQIGATPWHPHHITERYGLFTLILLGESLLASANAILDAGSGSTTLAPLIATGVLAFVATAALWWIYFWPPHHTAISTLGSSLAYGYGHYFVFAAAGAFSAGIEVEVDAISGTSAIHTPAASFAYTVPLSIFVFGVWLLVVRPYGDRWVNVTLPAAAALVLVDPLIPVPFALTTVVLAVAVGVLVWRQPQARKTRRSTIA